jgi:hypothetical protein
LYGSMAKSNKTKILGGLGILDLERFSRVLWLRWLWQEWVRPKRPSTGTASPCNSVDKAFFQASTVGMGDKSLVLAFVMA